MEKIRKILFAFVCLFGVGVINAEASVTVNGENLTAENSTVTFTDGGSITWDDTDKVLTIDSAKVTLDSSTEFINISNEDVKILLKGESVVINTGTGTIIHGNDNKVTITGEGSLKSESVNRNIWVTGTLVLDGAKLDVTSTSNQYSSYAIEADNLTIEGNSKIKVVANGTAIGAFSAIVVDNSEIDAESKLTFHSTIVSNKVNGLGTISIENSSIKAKSAYTSIETYGVKNPDDTSNMSVITINNSKVITENGYFGIRSLGNININNSTVSANNVLYGVYALDGNFSLLTIKDSTINVNLNTDNGSKSVLAYDGVTIEKSTLNIDGGTYGIQSAKFINFKKSNINIKNTDYGVRVNSTGTISVDNTEFDINTDKYAFYKAPTFTNMNNNKIYVNDKDVLNSADYDKINTYKIVRSVALYSVAIETDENSTVNVEKSLIVENGTKLEINISSLEGNKLSSVLVNGVEKLSELVEGKLSLTITENTEIKVISKAVETKTEVPTIDTTKEVTEVTIGVKEDKTTKETLTKALEKSNIDVSGFDSKVVVSIENQKEEDAPANAVKSIKALAKENGKIKIASFFDITLNVKNADTNETVGTLTELDSKLTFNVALPTDLTTVAEGYTRTYYIVRYHDGVSEILNTTLSGNVLTFETDKFSTYAIAYTDTLTTPAEETTKVENPSTGDNINAYVATGLVSLIGLTTMSVYVLRKEEN